MSEKNKYEGLSTSILKNNLIAPESTEEDFDNKSLKKSCIENNRILNNFKTIERTTNTNKEEEKINRVRDLSKKLSKIRVQENERYNMIKTFESKYEKVQENIIFSYETLKSKYKTLKENSYIMKKKLEEELDNKNDLKINITDRLKKLENKAKSMIIEENELFKSYCDGVCMKLEGELMSFENKLKRDDDNLFRNINDIKEIIKVK